MIEVIVVAYVGLSATWLLYTSTINVLRARNELPWYAMVAAAPWILLAVSVNVVFLQAIVGTMLFLELPRWDKGEWLLTDRLRRYRTEQPGSWRGAIAKWVCEKWLNPTDPKKDHC